MRYFRSQSAMEYLTTYGWFIIIIAVVLGVLYSLGVFNPSNFAAKVQAGSCYVYRPDGPGSTHFINLAGECNNGLPKFVAHISGYGGYPIVSNIIDYNYLPNGTDALTIIAWVKIDPADTGAWQRVVSYGTETCNGKSVGLEINGAGVTGSVTYDPECGPAAWTADLNVNDNNWHMIGVSLPAGRQTDNAVLYFDGISEPVSVNGNQASNIDRQYVVIGGGPGSPAITGYISNVQIYDVVLGSNTIKELYNEGIGGEPVQLQNLVGWWPLNGNTQDYSGNGDTGQITGGTTFTNQWTGGYSPP